MEHVPVEVLEQKWMIDKQISGKEKRMLQKRQTGAQCKEVNRDDWW